VPCKGPARATKGLKGALQRPRKGPKGALTGASNGLKKTQAKGGMGREGWEGEEREGGAEKVWRRWQRRSGVLTSRGRHNGEALAGPGGAGGGEGKARPVCAIWFVCLFACLFVCVCVVCVSPVCVYFPFCLMRDALVSPLSFYICSDCCDFLGWLVCRCCVP